MANEQVKSMSDIRQLLAEQMDALKQEKTTAGTVNAMCNATGKFLATIKLEMEFARMVGRQPEGTFWKAMVGRTPLPAPAAPPKKK